MFSRPPAEAVTSESWTSKPRRHHGPTSVQQSGCCSTVRVSWPAPECLAAFWTASKAQKYSAASTDAGRFDSSTQAGCTVTGMALVVMAEPSATISPSSLRSLG